MPLIFVTGISTSGKSAVAKELSARGFKAVDIEHSGHAAYYNKATGAKAAEFDQAPERTAAWLNAHSWLIDAEWVSSMREAAKSETIFLCGGGSNEEDISRLCDVTIWLKTDEKTIRQRVTNERDHDYGAKPHELAKIISQNNVKEQIITASGAILIDATRPLELVVKDLILASNI